MCGIFAYLAKQNFSKKRCTTELIKYFRKIQHRGPDNSQFIQYLHNPDLFLGFHRLAINGLDHESDQPLYINSEYSEYGGYYLICNGEIYNWKELMQNHGFKAEYQTHSDCEIILHMYKKYGLEQTLKELDGVFAGLIYDVGQNTIHIFRDKYGVRQLFIGYNTDKTEIGICSEVKGLAFMEHCKQFPPANYLTIELSARSTPISQEGDGHYIVERFIENFRDQYKNIRNRNRFLDSNNEYQDFDYQTYFEHDYPTIYQVDNEKQLLLMIKDKFTRAVKKRMMSDRKIGCLLSGGLDSSLIAGILASFYNNPKDLNTFSIGIVGSPDLIAGQKVADWIGSTHHRVELSEEEFLVALEETVKVVGSYDATTIRASVGHLLVCRYIRDNTDIKVVFSGEYADEQNLSYLYGMMAPSASAFQEESIRLLEDIQYFDNLRGDHCISNNGLEARVPFADHDFMSLMMSINPSMKMFNNSSNGRMEKYLLRKAFEESNIIPNDILWRRKNGFSDSVSNKTRSWSDIIKEYIDSVVSDEEYEFVDSKCSTTKEIYYYKILFNQYYGIHSEYYQVTPYQWLPKWCGDINDPSARKLVELYEAD